MLTDTSYNVIPPNVVHVDTLITLLNSTGVAPALPKQPENPLFKILKPLEHLLEEKKLQKVETLFTGVAGLSGSDGDHYLDREGFIKVLIEEAKMTHDDAASLSKHFEEADGKVSLKQVQSQLDASAKLQSIIKIGKISPEEGKKLVEETFKHIKRFMAMHEVNIVDIFRDCELEVGYFGRQELSQALERVGLHSSDEEHNNRIDALFMEYDPQRTLKIDYMKLLQDIYDKANAKVVT